MESSKTNFSMKRPMISASTAAKNSNRILTEAVIKSELKEKTPGSQVLSETCVP
jgi:hypothetical protein